MNHTTIITFKEIPTSKLKEMTLNIEDLSPFGRFLLNGNTTAVFNGQFIDLYLNGRRYYQYGFSYYGKDDWYGKEGYELIG